MEYLTLQDIPHRHHDQPHSRRMTLQSSERPLGSMAAANHHMRSSPPIQPGEQNSTAKLPSFSEFLNTTRQHTPPKTPSRRNESADSSPHAQPYFEDVAWSDKRRRIDTLGDIYARPSVSDHSQAEPRRLSSAIDPNLARYGSPRPVHHVSGHASGSIHQHRSSHSYPPPHVRHQSSPAPLQYGQQHPQQGHLPPGAYAPPAVQHGPVYEHRPSYFQEPQPHGYNYDRASESYYGRPPFPPSHHSYDNAYGELRFQQHVGLDHNAFNRKRRGNLPKEATNILKDWFNANRGSPYPTEDQKMELCQRTGLSLNQVSNWFINARRRAPQKEQREREANHSEA
ncbi:homeodomain superfamily [Coniothyrium glycines]